MHKRIICKAFALAISLVIALTAFTACGNAGVTLESMKNALTEAGYTIVEEALDISEYTDEHSVVGGFVFVFPGAHGDMDIPVFEFENSSAANRFATNLNRSGHWAAVVNGSFLTMAHAHGGVPHADEAAFLRNLLNGNIIN